MSSPGPAAPMRSLMRTFACAIAALALSFVARITDPNDASRGTRSARTGNCSCRFGQVALLR